MFGGNCLFDANFIPQNPNIIGHYCHQPTKSKHPPKNVHKLSALLFGKKVRIFQKKNSIMGVAVQKMTYREFREMEFDDNDPYLYELLKGALVRKSSPTLIHQRISRKLLLAFENYISQKKCGEIFYAPLDVVLDENTAPQPDLVYVSNENSAVLNEVELVIVGTPDLVIEILSPGTAKRDKTLKKEIYEEFGVKEYWLVDPGNKTIEVYTLKDSRYELFFLADLEDNLKSALLPDLEMDLNNIF